MTAINFSIKPGGMSKVAHRWKLSSPPPKNILDVHVYLEQFLLETTVSQLNSFCTIGRERERPPREGQGTIQDQWNQGASLFAFLLHMDSEWELQPGSPVDMQGAVVFL